MPTPAKPVVALAKRGESEPVFLCWDHRLGCQRHARGLPLFAGNTSLVLLPAQPNSCTESLSDGKDLFIRMYEFVAGVRFFNRTLFQQSPNQSVQMTNITDGF